MIAFLIVTLAVWAVCGTLAYGATLAHLQREFPSVADYDFCGDVKSSLHAAALGPIGLVTSWAFTSFKHGLMYRNPHK